MSFDKAKSERQADRMMHNLQKNGDIQSVGTYRNYEGCLKRFCDYIKENRLGDLKGATVETAKNYLDLRAGEVSQKTLDMDRQAIQKMLIFTGKLNEKETLPVTKSELATELQSRAYTPDQVKLVAEQLNDRNRLSTELAYACGLRAHELFTIQPASEQPADRDGRPNDAEGRFQGREGELYTVVGKGGLCREVVVPQELAQRLEAVRLDEPREVIDRGVRYQSHYDLAGGKALSEAFTKASKEALEWSNGFHGLRHSYAQERMDELKHDYTYEERLEAVSQELGHFRPEITLTYLR